MPEVRNLFTGSKMNKDLDERLLPQGEYRDGQNISVSKSEGPDEGVVENILGNSQYSNFGFESNTEIIGYYVDTNKDRIYIFATNFNDSSPGNLSNFPVDSVPHPAGGTIAGANCYIAYIEGPLAGGNAASGIIVQGAFLNFSKTHPMLGVDLIEDLLFFTDNRNQPRKINVETAIANPTYYTNEDHISVAKYAPYDTISFIDPATDLPTAKDTLNEYLPANSACVVNSTTSTNVVLQYGTLDIDITNTTTRFLNIDKPELGYFKITQISGNAANGVTFGNIQFEYPIGSGYDATQSMAAANAAAVQYYGSGSTAFSVNNILQLEELNPHYESNFQGDENYLKDKFVRFSYRFKYDDNEYSLMAPFSQPLFVPKQYGYFLDSAYTGQTKTRRDEKNTAESGVLKLMENQITRANLIIDLPPKFNSNVLSLGARAVQSEVANEFKINQVQILLKESNSNAIRVVDEISVEDNFTSSSLRYYAYNYVSNKPYKVLPDNVSLRIHDKVPIKAAAQATAGNRIIYGNFIEKHASPENLNYNLGISEKFADGDPSLVNPERSRVRREYINHTVKQNRSYKVGIVLVDRYGRSSNVILRDEAINVGVAGEFGSLYAPYENVESVLNWPGNSLKVQFNDLIPTNKADGYPGIFSATNPLGYLSYKVVVQQKEQEYYNVFTPGATSGKITFKGQIGDTSTAGGNVAYHNAASVSNIVLYGDNVNKVPKQLSDVGPTETIYGSETLLYPRVVTKYIANATNSPTVWNPTPASSESSQVTFKNEFTVNSILSFKDLGEWVLNRSLTPLANSSYPNDGTNYIDPLYLDASNNPFVAQLETSFLVGFAPGVQQDTSGSRPFSNNLNVFETNPVESELDIYWESSTAGTIAKLNQYVNNGASGGIGVDIGTPTSPPQPVAFSLEETQVPSGTSWIGEEFQAVDANNSLMTVGTIELAGVTDGNGAVLNPAPFDLVLTNPLKYRLKSNTYFYYGADIGTRTFNISLRILANGNNIVTKTCLLTNEKPFVNPSLANNLSGFAWYEGEIGNPSSGSAGSESYPYPIFSVPPTAQRGPNALIGAFNTQTTVFNGSAGTSLDNLEVLVQKDGTSTAQSFFYFNTVTPETYIRIVNDQQYLLQNVGQKVLLKVIVKDCNGLTGFAFRYYSTWIEIQ